MSLFQGRNYTQIQNPLYQYIKSQHTAKLQDTIIDFDLAAIPQQAPIHPQPTFNINQHQQTSLHTTTFLQQRNLKHCSPTPPISKKLFSLHFLLTHKYPYMQQYIYTYIHTYITHVYYTYTHNEYQYIYIYIQMSGEVKPLTQASIAKIHLRWTIQGAAALQLLWLPQSRVQRSLSWWSPVDLKKNNVFTFRGGHEDVVKLYSKMRHTYVTICVFFRCNMYIYIYKHDMYMYIHMHIQLYTYVERWDDISQFLSLNNQLKLTVPYLRFRKKNNMLQNLSGRLPM